MPALLLRFLPYIGVGLLALALVLAPYLYGRHQGAASVQAKWDADIAKAQTLADAQRGLRQAIADDAAKLFEEKLAGLRIERTVIEREVTRYVTRQTDIRYPLPWGLIRLH